ncbi:probable calcium-binding protein CML48 [Aristolochia californica]|uniref:probable calcium-binding protein CML48 n=1 Tax=Aristolochia californica TaxID=171875 RepID=UPI0035D64CB6
MASFNRYPSHNYSPSAPPLPDYSQQGQQQRPSSQGQSYLHPPNSYGYEPSASYGNSSFPTQGAYFPPGTHPEIVRSFQMVDKDRSGFIDEMELQAALSSGYQKFSLRTIRLLMFLFKNPNDSSSKIGPTEFVALWNSLGQWRATFERFDRDRSGKIDSFELRDALYSLGYMIPPSVLQVLISKYDDGSGRRGALDFDDFVECGVIVKGLTEKFKQKDPRYTGSATLTYDSFMSMIIPFLVA